jgi:hypothetical protein
MKHATFCSNISLFLWLFRRGTFLGFVIPGFDFGRTSTGALITSRWRPLVYPPILPFFAFGRTSTGALFTRRLRLLVYPPSIRTIPSFVFGRTSTRSRCARRVIPSRLMRRFIVHRGLTIDIFFDIVVPNHPLGRTSTRST